MMRESTIERYFVRKVKAAGGEVRKLVTPGRKHAPDRLVLWPAWWSSKGSKDPRDGTARIDFVELKAPGKKPRPGQLREHNRLRKMGFSTFVIDSTAGVDSYGRACAL